MTLWIKVCVSCVPSGVCRSYMYCIVLPCHPVSLCSALASRSRSSLSRSSSAKFIHLSHYPSVTDARPLRSRAY